MRFANPEDLKAQIELNIKYFNDKEAQQACDEEFVRRLLESAWDIIANANNGDWDSGDLIWRGAAIRWRDRYFSWKSENKDREYKELVERAICKGWTPPTLEQFLESK